jgi:hypothetical protein
MEEEILVGVIITAILENHMVLLKNFKKHTIKNK